MFDPVINQLPAFAAFFATAVVLLGGFLALYVVVTPYNELALIREGNAAAALSLGGALSAWIVNLYGYVPNVAQTETALLGIRLGASLYPALMLGLGLVCLVVYPIGKKLNLRSQDELAERRLKLAGTAVS